MNRITEHITLFSAGIVLLLSAASTGLAQQSDYEIYRSFQESHAEMERELDRIGRSAEADTLMKQIRQLELEYEEHRELLDQALWPDSYYDRINSLKQQTIALRDRLIRLEILDERVEELDRQITSYETRLRRYDRRTDSLLAVIRSSAGREEELSGMVEEYREELEQRDRFILGMIDSLVTTYRAADLQMPHDLARGQQQIDLGEEQDAIALIEYVAGENSDYLESTVALSAKDYLRMKTIQVEFSDMWNRMGDDLISLYASRYPAGIRTYMDEVLDRWDRRITNQMWIALNDAIQNHQLPVGEVNTREDLFEELNGYVERSIEQSRAGGSRDQYEQYQRFNEFWNERVKMQWAEYSDQAQVLSHRQIATVDRNMEEWQELARPKSNLMAYLFGIGIVLFILIGARLIRA